MERLNPRNLDLEDAAVASEFERVDRNVGRLEATRAIIEFFAGDVNNVPDDYHVCDGRTISRNDNKRLFGFMGERFGAGDGATTFNLPNLMGRVPVGITVGQFAGQVQHLDVGTGSTYDVDLFRLVPVVRKG